VLGAAHIDLISECVLDVDYLKAWQHYLNLLFELASFGRD
jgi:hypothetical protein